MVAEIRDDYLKNIDIFDSIVDRMVRQTGREHGITPSTVILISVRCMFLIYHCSYYFDVASLSSEDYVR